MTDCSPLLNGCGLLNIIYNEEEARQALNRIKKLAEGWANTNGYNRIYGKQILEIIEAEISFSIF